MSRAIPDKKIIAVLPAYHAVKTLQTTFDAIPKNWFDEVILVDDASVDDTVSLARSLGITTFAHQRNRGYGGNQKTCYREALAEGADIVVMIHPDFQYDPGFAPELIRPIAEGRVDAMFGSRMLTPGGAIEGGMPRWKYLANIFLTAIGNIVLGYGLSEYHSGFRAYSRSLLERLPIELNSDNFIFDTEIIIQMKAAGLRVEETPIKTKYFPEASTVGFFKGIEYGTSFLAVLAKYLMHRIGIVRIAAYVPLTPNNAMQCPGCESSRFQIVYPARSSRRENKGEFLRYAITEDKSSHHEIVRCLSCSLVYIPRRLVPDLAAAYRDQAFDAEYVSEERGRRMAARRTLRKLSKLFCGDTSGKRLLEIGPGAGFFMDEARRAGWSVSGIEPGVVWEQFAREKLGLDTIRRGGNELMHEFPDGHFDVVSAWDVVEHMEDPFAFFRLAAEKLTPGGILALSTPRLDSAVGRLLGARWHAILPSHLTYFTYASLKNYLHRAGFTIVARRSYLRFFSLQYLLNRIRLKHGDGILRTVTVPVNFFDEMEVYARLERPRA